MHSFPELLYEKVTEVTFWRMTCPGNRTNGNPSPQGGYAVLLSTGVGEKCDALQHTGIKQNHTLSQADDMNEHLT